MFNLKHADELFHFWEVCVCMAGVGGGFSLTLTLNACHTALTKYILPTLRYSAIELTRAGNPDWNTHIQPLYH